LLLERLLGAHVLHLHVAHLSFLVLFSAEQIPLRTPPRRRLLQHDFLTFLTSLPFSSFPSLTQLATHFDRTQSVPFSTKKLPCMSLPHLQPGSAAPRATCPQFPWAPRSPPASPSRPASSSLPQAGPGSCPPPPGCPRLYEATSSSARARFLKSSRKHVVAASWALICGRFCVWAILVVGALCVGGFSSARFVWTFLQSSRKMMAEREQQGGKGGGKR
jgi:hypothetical protein